MTKTVLFPDSYGPTLLIRLINHNTKAIDHLLSVRSFSKGNCSGVFSASLLMMFWLLVLYIADSFMLFVILSMFPAKISVERFPITGASDYNEIFWIIKNTC